MKNLALFALFVLIVPPVHAQTTEVPVLGAQVFIEPGQKAENVERWFRLLKEHNMKVCRIRIFEEHLKDADGNWNFTLYDRAFDEAHKNDIKVFATLFPAVDPDNIGGFKFPKTKRHQALITEYIKQVVDHFKEHPALYTWVLINEPGVGKAPLSEPFTKKKYGEWLENRRPSDYNNGYRKEELLPEKFLRDYNTWYLKWLSDEVKKYDTGHPQHVNPHMIFGLLPEYDFNSWYPFLNSVGASMHPSWHFGYFSRDQYTLAISANNDIIREGAANLPFWVTELQGGNNTYSGYYPMNPTQEEIAQWLWTSIGCGAEGIIFWSLNQRATGGEAGEWGMVTNYNEPSDRLTMTKKVGEALQEQGKLFQKAVPLKTNIDIVYVPESMMVQNRYKAGWKAAPSYEGRQEGACIKSALAYYEALQELGVSSALTSLDDFDWSNGTGETVILANMIALPSRSWDKIDQFVKTGGKLIVSGLTGYYDENVHNVMLTGFPLEQTFGAGISEFKHISELFEVRVDKPMTTLPAHLWQGELKLFGATAIANEDGTVLASRHAYGKGEVVWIPALIGLGAWLEDNSALADLLKQELASSIEKMPFSFDGHRPKVLMRTLISGNDYITILINKNKAAIKMGLNNPKGYRPQLIFSNETVHTPLDLQPEETQVIRWSK